MATLTLPAPAVRRPAARAPRTTASAPRPVARTASAARASAPVRLTPRGRRLARTMVIALALLVALTVSVLGRGVSAGQAGDAPATVATSTVVVQPGQTLWAVAQSLHLDDDVRDTVARIQELNDLGPSGATLRPGQELIVPLAG